jgi:hypothetical protein
LKLGAELYLAVVLHAVLIVSAAAEAARLPLEPPFPLLRFEDESSDLVLLRARLAVAAFECRGFCFPEHDDDLNPDLADDTPDVRPLDSAPSPRCSVVETGTCGVSMLPAESLPTGINISCQREIESEGERGREGGREGGRERERERDR